VLLLFPICWLALLFRTLEVTDSGLFHWGFCQPCRVNIWIAPQNKKRPSPSSFHPIYYSLIILQFNMQSELLIMPFSNYKQANKQAEQKITSSFFRVKFRMREAVELYALYIVKVLNVASIIERPDTGFVCLSSHPLDKCCWITLTQFRTVVMTSPHRTTLWAWIALTAVSSLLRWGLISCCHGNLSLVTVLLAHRNLLPWLASRMNMVAHVGGIVAKLRWLHLWISHVCLSKVKFYTATLSIRP
jgi:hypothetical protein